MNNEFALLATIELLVVIFTIVVAAILVKSGAITMAVLEFFS